MAPASLAIGVCSFQLMIAVVLKLAMLPIIVEERSW